MSGLFIPGIGNADALIGTAFFSSAHWFLINNIDPRQKFWMGKGTPWPRDAFGKVFLGRAMERLGKAMYPNTWTGGELSALDHIEQLPERPDLATQGQLQKVYGGTGVHDLALWRKARADRIFAAQMVEGALSRRRSAQQFLAELMLSGSVNYFTRNDRTGRFDGPHPLEWWNTENVDPRFYWCQISQAEPISDHVGGTGFQWLFVEGVNLDAVIAELANNVGANVPVKDTPKSDMKTASPKAKRAGAPLKYFWAEFDTHCREVWEFHEGFSPDDPEFSRQSHLVRIMEEWCLDQVIKKRAGWPAAPSHSLTKAKVRAMLKILQKEQADKLAN